MTDGTVAQVAERSTGLAEVRARFHALARDDARLVIEDKESSLALHYRRAPERESELRELVEGAASGHDRHHVMHGKMVLEVRPAHADKGTAIAHFLETPPFAGRKPVFAGDDVTDEDGFEAVNRHGGISVKVGTGKSAAGYRVPDVAALHDWPSSRALAAWTELAQPLRADCRSFARFVRTTAISRGGPNAVPRPRRRAPGRWFRVRTDYRLRPTSAREPGRPVIGAASQLSRASPNSSMAGNHRRCAPQRKVTIGADPTGKRKSRSSEDFPLSDASRHVQEANVYPQPRCHRQLHLRRAHRRGRARRVVLSAALRRGSGVLQPDRRRRERASGLLRHRSPGRGAHRTALRPEHRDSGDADRGP